MRFFIFELEFSGGATHDGDLLDRAWHVASDYHEGATYLPAYHNGMVHRWRITGDRRPMGM